LHAAAQGRRQFPWVGNAESDSERLQLI